MRQSAVPTELEFTEVYKKVPKTITQTIVVLTFLALLNLQAAGPVIGIAVSNGSMQVDRAAVTGNANLSEGSTLASGAAPARIQLNSGKRAALGPNSEARIFGDRVALVKGSGLAGASGYKVEANGLSVVAAGNALAGVSIENGKVQVEAQNGPAKVVNSSGLVIARVMPGAVMSFKPGAVNDRTSTMTGTLREQGGRYTLKDELSNLDVELKGAGLAPALGSRVEVTGKASPSADRESQIIEVAKLNVLEPEQQSPGAARPTGAGAPKGAPKPQSQPSGTSGGTGMSTGAKVAIIAAIAGGAGAGAAFALMSR